MSELHMFHVYFFNLRLHVFHVQFCCFRIGRSSARNYRAIEKIDILLAHLSRRLIGELIVYKGIRRPSVVRLSTFSNHISSEAMRPILFIFHI